MGRGAVAALAADRQALLALAQGWGPPEWNAPSGCPGWAVQDVVAHMGTLFWAVVDPSNLPDTSGSPTEEAQDVLVAARRDWPATRVLSDYESVGTIALERLAGLEGQEFEVPLGDLGTYPASLVPSAFAFDHYTHIRVDLFGPRGPLPGTPPPSDELRLAPTIDWIEAALPQQNRMALAAMGGSVTVAIGGPGSREIQLGVGEPVARVETTSEAFVRWITHRGTWDELGVNGSGDSAVLGGCAALRVF